MPHKTRGRPFAAGNPGRPRGAKNKTTIMLEQLNEGHAEQLINKTIELAMEGNVRCLGMLLDRIWPARKSAPIALEFPPIKSPEDVLAAVAALWTEVGYGRVSPEEALALSQVAQQSMKAIEQQDVLKRLEDLEKEKERNDAKNNPA
jgi:hypothetical protein